MIFGILGVSDVIIDMISTSVSVDDSATSDAGEPSKYNFAFKTNKGTHLPKSTYIELWIPGFNFIFLYFYFIAIIL